MPSSMPLRKAVARSERQDSKSIIHRRQAKKDRLPKWAPWLMGIFLVGAVIVPLLSTILYSPKMKD